ncbi:glycosyltransferase [Neoroseomonas lacus]|uniref:Ceramide glucosyltransferase n=1 Tax=Neoroseomonas lacus TaxID=287609 RepID=A0A917K9P9_9PROT|nr:glycosyltransferase family A protein [Neoroseomonas lacus]GGJ03878.1 ceramide glucosyltransferase [Neoroseomonas lacus]
MTIALGTTALLATLAWLAGVIWFIRFFRPPAIEVPGQVTLLLAVTGRTEGLPQLFAALARQTLRPRRLLVAVEAETDPALDQVRELEHLLPFPVEIVIAGLDDTRSQKATNMMAACARVDAGDDALVLLDADILPQDHWLSWLATPAMNGAADVVTGYRWHALDGAGPGRHVVAWLDRSLALGPRFLASGLVWGGSVAVSRDAFARMDLPGALSRTFSTDGAISRRARALGLRVLTRRAVLLPTPPEGGDREAIAFKTRQLQIVHVYVPSLWVWLGVALHAEALALPVALLGVAGDAVALGFLAAIASVGLLRAALHDRVTRAVGIREGVAARLAQLALGALAPVTAPAAASLFWTSARTRVIRWRHIDYEVLGPEQVRVLHRRTPGDAA